MSSLDPPAQKSSSNAWQREKVEIIFGYPGEKRHASSFMTPCTISPIKHVLVRHEQNAAFARRKATREPPERSAAAARLQVPVRPT